MPSVRCAPISSSSCFEIDGDDAGRARIGEFAERRLLHRAVARRQEDEGAFLLKVGCRDDGRQVLVLLELHQAGNRLAARGRRGLRNFVHLEPVDAALRAEQQNVTVRRGDEQILDEIFLARFRADAALAAARLVAVHIHRRALDVARVADGDGHVHVGDQVFQLDLLDALDDLGATRIGVGFLDLAQLRDDHGLQLLFARQDLLQLGDQRADFASTPSRIFSHREPRQPVELQFEDGLRSGELRSNLHCRSGRISCVELNAFESFCFPAGVRF